MTRSRGGTAGVPLLKDHPYDLYISHDMATLDDTQRYVLRYAADTPDEWLVFRNADGIVFHATGA